MTNNNYVVPPRVEIAEGQEFSVNGNIFVWHFSNEAKTQVVMTYLPQKVEPVTFTVSSIDQLQLFDND